MWLAGSDRARALRLFLLGAALAMTPPGPAQADQANNNVRRRPRLAGDTGTPSTLVIRQEPRPGSPRVGEIPASARGLITSGRKQRIGRSVWHEVQYRGVRGWVNASPPRQAVQAEATAALPEAGVDTGVFLEDLVCVGRAPDWKLVIDRDGSVDCNAGCSRSASLRALPARQDKQQKGVWRMAIRDDQDNDVMLVSLRYGGACSDGVSGDAYAYRINTLSADGVRQSGCCNRLERGGTATAIAPYSAAP
jgi:uncharacterized membrane protein